MGRLAIKAMFGRHLSFFFFSIILAHVCVLERENQSETYLTQILQSWRMVGRGGAGVIVGLSR